jgi:hypothetical protein
LGPPKIDCTREPAQRPHHTLHDPVASKRREVGEHFLNGTHPPFTLYT